MSDYIELGSVAEYVSDRIDTKRVDKQNYISTENMIAKRGGVTSANSLPTSKTVLNYKPKDILISNIRLYFEKIWFADKKGGSSADVLVLRVKKAYHPQFIYYALSDSNFFKYADVTSKGTKMPRGDKKAILKYIIPDYSVYYQTKIADILSTYDKLIENNNRRIKILEQTAEELYKEWFVRMRFPGYENTKFGKGIPEGWEVKKVKELVKRYRYGSLYKENDVMQEGNVIVIDQSEKDFLGFHNNEPDHFAGIDNPIILFGDHSCKMLIMTSPFSLSENVIPFNAENNLNTLFLFYAVRGLVHTTEYKRHWSDLTNKRILVPDYSLQQKFEAKVKSVIILINEYKKSNLNLIKQRDLLLPRLMNGTITVK